MIEPLSGIHVCMMCKEESDAKDVPMFEKSGHKYHARCLVRLLSSQLNTVIMGLLRYSGGTLAISDERADEIASTVFSILDVACENAHETANFLISVYSSNASMQLGESIGGDMDAQWNAVVAATHLLAASNAWKRARESECPIVFSVNKVVGNGNASDNN